MPVLARIVNRLARDAELRRVRADSRRLPSPPFDPAGVRKILVPLYAGIGNVVLYGPALRAIRARFPAAELTIAVGNGRRNEEVLGPEIVDRVVEVPLDPPSDRRRADFERLRGERFDLCVNAFHCVFPYQAAFTAHARIPWRCGHVSSPGWTNPYDFLYNLPARMELDQYEVDRYLELAYALGVPRDDVDRGLFFRVSDEARARAAVLLAARGVDTHGALVAVHAGTSDVMRWKQWGIERFEAVVRRMAERDDLAFVLVGAPDERDEQLAVSRRLAAALPGRFADLVGETDVATLAALLERSRLLVGNDSGPMQIAVALGVPVVVPWGPSDRPRNAPQGPEHTVIFKGLPCSPCYRMPGDSKVHLCADHVCLSSITVDEVAAAALGRLAPAARS